MARLRSRLPLVGMSAMALTAIAVCLASCAAQQQQPDTAKSDPYEVPRLGQGIPPGFRLWYCCPLVAPSAARQPRVGTRLDSGATLRMEIEQTGYSIIPLPQVWVCHLQQEGYMPGPRPEAFRPHKPSEDEVVFPLLASQVRRIYQAVVHADFLAMPPRQSRSEFLGTSGSYELYCSWERFSRLPQGYRGITTDFFSHTVAVSGRATAGFQEIIKAINDALPKQYQVPVPEDGRPTLPAGKDRRDVGALTAALKDNDPAMRWSAALALGELGDKIAVAALSSALNDKDGQVRAMAAEALGKIKDGDAVKPLIRVLEDDDWNAAGQAAWALGEIGDPRAVKPLAAYLKGAYSTRMTAVAARALGKIGTPALGSLMAHLRASGPGQHWIATGAFAGIGKPAIEPLLASFKDKSPSVRAGAAEALGWLPDSRTVEPLLVALKDKDRTVRSAAASALGQTDDARAAVGLVMALRDKDHEVARMAALSLRGKTDAHAADLAIALLKDKDPWVRMNAAEALGQMKPTRAVEPLIAALRDKYGGVQQQAAMALGWIGDRRAVTSLIAALKYSKAKPEVAFALGELKDAQAADPLAAALRGKDLELRHNAALALNWIGRPAVDPLLGYLKSGDRGLRGYSAWVIGTTHDLRVVPALIELLNDKDEYVRVYAADGLEETTEQSFGLDKAQWQRWWKDQKPSEPDTDTRRLHYGEIVAAYAAADAKAKLKA